MFSQQGFFFPNEPGIYKIIQNPQKDSKSQDNQPQSPRPLSLNVNQQEFANSLGYGYIYVDDFYKEPPKLYGNVDERANYIWNNFVQNSGSSGVLFTGKRGSGKMSRNSSLVRVPDGWVEIGNLRVGDSVMAIDGTYTKVIGVYPQGMKQLYRITFSDGRTHDCGAEHLWGVYKYYVKTHIENDKRIVDECGRKLITMNTKDIMEHLKNKSNTFPHWLHIPLCLPEKNTSKDFFIHPYILGCILGDGGISNGRVNLTISDPEVVDRLLKFLHKDYTITINSMKTKSVPTRSIVRKMRVHYAYDPENKHVYFYNQYIQELKRLNLLGCTSLNKFIPEEYMNGSEEQRWELLKGMMDTDGWVDVARGRNNKNKQRQDGQTICGTPYISSSSKQLIEDIQQLVWSLGGIARISKRYPFYTYKGEKRAGAISYRLIVRVPTPRRLFSRNYRRLERLRKSSQYSNKMMLRIVNVEEIDCDYATCIEIDHPSSLYVTQDYIVTHNTQASKHLANIAISKGLKVFVVAELRIEKKLISFISNLNNCVIFIDEFYKVIGWQYQDDFLSLMSDGNKKRLFILTENDTSNINRYILDRPERIRYHYEYSTLDPNIIREFCQDHDVPMDFENQLLKLNMSNKNFCFDHLQSLVTEAINSGRWDLEWLISILNVKSLKMKEIKRPVKVCAMDNLEIFLDLEPSAIKDDLGLVKIGNAILNTNYRIWDDLKNNRPVNEAAIANYESSKSTIDHFEEKMELMDKIAKQASNLDTEGLGSGDNTRFRPVFCNGGNEEAPTPPSNIIKVNFSSEFMIGMEGDMYIYTDVTGEFKVYIENKKLVF